MRRKNAATILVKRKGRVRIVLEAKKKGEGLEVGGVLVIAIVIGGALDLGIAEDHEVVIEEGAETGRGPEAATGAVLGPEIAGTVVTEEGRETAELQKSHRRTFCWTCLTMPISKWHRGILPICWDRVPVKICR